MAAPGYQVPDGRFYQPGLAAAWAKCAGGPHPVALKVRQSFDLGWRTAAVEAASWASEIHAALIPRWNTGAPDWTWLAEIEQELHDLAVWRPDIDVYVRLGNYRDGSEEGCDFEQHARHELRFANLLTYPLKWAVGDDRGAVAAVTGWSTRSALWSGRAPACIEVQAYGRSGFGAGHVAPLSAALRRHGFGGRVALVEHHRGFPTRGAPLSSTPELFTAETGAYLREVYEACRSSGVAYCLFTADTVFKPGGYGALNPAGMELLAPPDYDTKAWQPPRVAYYWQMLRLLTA